MRNKVIAYIEFIFFSILFLVGLYLHDFTGALWTGSVAIFSLSNHIYTAKNQIITIAELALVVVSCIVVFMANRGFQFGISIEKFVLILLGLQVFLACLKFVLQRRHKNEEAE